MILNYSLGNLELEYLNVKYSFSENQKNDKYRIYCIY